ncbi:hypothetical protein BD410DRAFT_810349 [Rickenella mellea]|uniref:KOW domain-containing protein n=1 Tax=Rickenella mellea TaxID=50990 RepID=A0A4Y7PH10_9AGAM|nr:hypothetical protein BD410DRAFT_810349 [Rickenella mellea]
MYHFHRWLIMFLFNEPKLKSVRELMYKRGYGKVNKPHLACRLDMNICLYEAHPDQFLRTRDTTYTKGLAHVMENIFLLVRENILTSNPGTKSNDVISDWRHTWARKLSTIRTHTACNRQSWTQWIREGARVLGCLMLGGCRMRLNLKNNICYVVATVEYILFNELHTHKMPASSSNPRPSKKQRLDTQQGTHPFLDIEAREDERDEPESEEEEEHDGFFVDDIDIDNGEVRPPPPGIFDAPISSTSVTADAENWNIEDTVRRLNQKYGRSRREKLCDFAMDEVHDESEPGEFRDLFAVETQYYKSRICVGRVQDMARRKKVHVDAFQFEVKPNEIFIRADNPEDAKRACATSTYIRSDTMRWLPDEEADNILADLKKYRRVAASAAITTGWVRIKQGTYIGDVALVRKDTGSELEVACVPRIPHALWAKEDELRLRPKRELIRIDSIEELRRSTLKIDKDSPDLLTSFEWEDRTYQNGLEIITLPPGKWTPVEAPSVEEVIQFLESGIDEEASTYVTSILLQKDDDVEITDGEHAGLRGKIVETERGFLRVGDLMDNNGNWMETNEAVIFEYEQIRRLIHVGDNVRVVAGKHAAREGIVVNVDGDDLTFVSGHEEHITVPALYARTYTPDVSLSAETSERHHYKRGGKDPLIGREVFSVDKRIKSFRVMITDVLRDDKVRVEVGPNKFLDVHKRDLIDSTGYNLMRQNRNSLALHHRLVELDIRRDIQPATQPTTIRHMDMQEARELTPMPTRELTPIPEPEANVDPAWDPAAPLPDVEVPSPLSPPVPETRSDICNNENTATAKWLFQPEVCRHMATHQFTLRLAVDRSFENGSFMGTRVDTASKTCKPADDAFIALDVTWSGNRGKVWRQDVRMAILERVDPTVKKLGVVIEGEHLGKIVTVLSHSKDKKFATVEEIEEPKKKFKVPKSALNSVKEWEE